MNWNYTERVHLASGRLRVGAFSQVVWELLKTVSWNISNRAQVAHTLFFREAERYEL
jgi:hypothetical protein